jgi:hypothetical protein
MPTRQSRGSSDPLRGSIRPVGLRTTASRAGSRALRRSERTMLKRAVLVAVLLGSFLGSAVLLSKDNAPPVSVATQGWTDPVTTGSVRPAVFQPSNAFSGGAEDATEDLP